MSDFDKEAERERLREQYEADKEKREATERMSELLLRGATMTNRHCGECGSPVFRHDGQEFCPTCEAPVGDGADAAEAETEATGGDAAGAGAAGASAGRPPGTDTPDARTIEIDDGGDEGPAGGISTPESEGTADEAPTRARSNEASEAEPTRDRSTSGGDLEDARSSLTRTLHLLARRAEESEDVRRTRDYLGAAREAAEALAALDRAR